VTLENEPTFTVKLPNYIKKDTTGTNVTLLAVQSCHYAFLCHPECLPLPTRCKCGAIVLLLLLAGAGCAAQQRAHEASCPIEVAVAATNVPLENRDHIVLWFANHSPKTVAQIQFSVFLVSATSQYPVSEAFSFGKDVAPGNGGVVMHPAADEAARLASLWKQVRGLEVQPARVRFRDGSEWQPSGSACRRAFMNQNYIESMRRWNKEVRFQWNLAHPDEPMPSSAMAALLEQTSAR